MANKHSSLISGIQVAAPCPASWETMEGSEKVRFCGECKLHVYNLSAMTTSEAEKLVIEKEGKLCARFYRRKDGTVITENCPVGLRWLRKQIKMAQAFAALILSAFFSICRAQSQDLVESNVQVQISSLRSDECNDAVLVISKQSSVLDCRAWEAAQVHQNSHMVVLAESTARFYESNLGLELKDGKVVLLTRNKAEIITCGIGVINIPANAGVIAETNDGNKYLRLCNLIGRKQTITLESNGRHLIFDVEAGEELRLSLANDLGEDEISPPHDGVDREPIVGSVRVPGIPCAKSVFDRSMMIEREPLLSCANMNLGPVRNWISSLRQSISKESKPFYWWRPVQKPLMPPAVKAEDEAQ